MLSFDISASQLMFSGFLAFLASWIVSIIRTVFFHPLSSFPGPKLAAATRWYTVYYEVYKDGAMVDHLADLHAKYGPVVRSGPNHLHFNTFEAYNDIYVRGTLFAKDGHFYDPMDEKESSFGFTEPRAAKARREIVLPLFSRKSILKLEPVVQEKVDKLLDALVQNGKDLASVHLHRALRSFSLDVIISYCFAQDPQTMNAPNFTHPYTIGQELMFPKVLVLTNFPWYFVYRRWWSNIQDALHDIVFKRDFEKTLSFFRRTIRQSLISPQIDELLADPGRLEHEAHDTIFHHLLIPQSEKSTHVVAPSRSSLIDEAAALIGAGGDTVASTTAFGIYYLLNNQGVLERIVEELDAVWSTHATVGLQQLEKLPYLTAVIKESLRLSHGVVHPVPRIVDAAGAMIGGVHVPASSVVSVGQTFVHHNPDIYPGPYTFNPDRWLQTEARLDQYLVAFSKGPRACLGVNLAWCELYLLFGNILHFLSLNVAHGTVADYSKFRCHFIPTVAVDRQLQCEVRRRDV